MRKDLNGQVWITVEIMAVGGIIGAGIGNASYLADCGVNKKSVAIDELIVATVGGFVSGYIGGPGANQHMALTRTIQTSIKTTTRMSNRACTDYAAKQIASTKAWRNNVLTVSAMGGVLYSQQEPAFLILYLVHGQR